LDAYPSSHLVNDSVDIGQNVFIHAYGVGQEFLASRRRCRNATDPFDQIEDGGVLEYFFRPRLIARETNALNGMNFRRHRIHSRP
jgi:hypothetical protein